MAFTYEQIIGLENPYEQLSDGDALAENAKVLNGLSVKEKITLATKIISACPEAKFKQYGRHIEALRSLSKDEGTFHSTITEAYQVRQRIFALLDPRNKNPHTLILGKEFNPEPFHRFSDLAKQVLNSNESAIVERLALCAPEEARSEIARNIDTAFPKSALTTKTQEAFTLRRNIDKLLLGDKPEQFFTSRDFDKDTCKIFANMFRTLLKGHEETIGTKLFALEAADTRAKISRHLELLHTEAFDETNPFKLIAEIMSTKESSEQKKNTSQSTNPNGLFNRPSTPPLSKRLTDEALDVASKADDEKESSYEDESEEDEYDEHVFRTTLSNSH